MKTPREIAKDLTEKRKEYEEFKKQIKGNCKDLSNYYYSQVLPDGKIVIKSKSNGVYVERVELDMEEMEKLVNWYEGKGE